MCTANARANGIDNVVVCEPEQVPAELTFAGIWSNPPIRIGKDPLHQLLLRWLPRLAPGAHASLVVQRHLGSDSLAQWLASNGFVVDRLGSRRAYRILDISSEGRA